MTHPPAASDTWIVPELGPSLGRLSDPPGSSVPSGPDIVLDDIRLDLVTGLFDMAGAARSFAAGGRGSRLLDRRAKRGPVISDLCLKTQDGPEPTLNHVP